AQLLGLSFSASLICSWNGGFLTPTSALLLCLPSFARRIRQGGMRDRSTTPRVRRRPASLPNGSRPRAAGSGPLVARFATKRLLVLRIDKPLGVPCKRLGVVPRIAPDGAGYGQAFVD